ncbi:hypothetical protein ACIQK6_03830 [Streptomyces sp. NPDC091682]|uniref:hypothetical protein n=1 Tax=Streptomyces sp. NPDC091682 TaxID=3366005 RepID=UPI00382D3BAF
MIDRSWFPGLGEFDGGAASRRRRPTRGRSGRSAGQRQGVQGGADPAKTLKEEFHDLADLDAALEAWEDRLG